MTEEKTDYKAMNLYQKRNQAKIIVSKHTFVKKSASESGGLKFAYHPIEGMKPVVESAYNEVGILIDYGKLEFEDMIESYTKTSGYDGNQTRWFHLTGVLPITLVNMDDPTDKVTFEFIGEAKDNSDKVINKVYTSALKNFYKLEFNISERKEDDTDAIQDDEAVVKSNAKANRTYKPKADPLDPLFGNNAKEAPPAKPAPPADTKVADKPADPPIKAFEDVVSGMNNTAQSDATKAKDPFFMTYTAKDVK